MLQGAETLHTAAATILTLLAAGAAFAEDAPKKGAADAAPAAASGPDATTDTFGDWSVVCTTRPGAVDKTCEVNSTLTLRNQQQPFAKLAVGRPVKDKPTRLMALIPVNILAQAPVKVVIDPGKLEFSLPLRSCIPGGCLAEGELTKDQVQAMRSPMKTQGQLSITDAAGRPVAAQFSLKGLDQALDAYFKAQDK
jgi:invasion protein IalB